MASLSSMVNPERPRLLDLVVVEGVVDLMGLVDLVDLVDAEDLVDPVRVEGVVDLGEMGVGDSLNSWWWNV